MGRISFARVDDGGGVWGGGSRRLLARAVAAVGVAVAVLAAGCGGSDDQSPKARAASGPAGAANVELPGGRIAFRRYLDGADTRSDLLINPDGSDESSYRIRPAVVDDHPDWSPDGKRIAFERCAEGEPCQVLTVAADGGSPQMVEARCELRPICDLAAPAWTPDGRLVVTLAEGRVRSDPSMTGEEWIQQSAVELLDLGSGRQRTIVERGDWTGDAGTPAVSPDGRTVIYSRWNSWRSEPPNGQAIFVVNRDGSNHRRLTPWRLGGGDHPGFSPDGTILFRSYEDDDTQQSDFWTVRPDGTDLAQLTHYEQGTIVLSASYSSDGEWIVHATGGVNGNADVYVMRADGTDNQPVTQTELWDSAPDWGPAGS